MSPNINKRQRAQDGAPHPTKKRKIRVTQNEYHSSSEEDEQQAQKSTAKIDHLRRPKPKAFLKKTIVTSRHSAPTEDDSKADEIFDNELARNTATNAAGWNDDNDDEEEEVEEEEKEEEEDDDDDDDDGKEHDLARLDGNGGIVADGDEEARQEPHDDGNDDLADDDDDSESDMSLTSSQAARVKRKRNDASAFATSISKILSTKLTTSKRADPVLSRSSAAANAQKSLTDDRLERKARAQVRAEKKAAKDKGHVGDVLGFETEGVETAAVIEVERKLKKTAQRGVVTLFNAVRAAQVKAEEALKEAHLEGVVGMKQREERVTEMSKQGFLDLISRGGKTSAT